MPALFLRLVWRHRSDSSRSNRLHALRATVCRSRSVAHSPVFQHLSSLAPSILQHLDNRHFSHWHRSSSYVWRETLGFLLPNSAPAALRRVSNTRIHRQSVCSSDKSQPIFLTLVSLRENPVHDFWSLLSNIVCNKTGHSQGGSVVCSIHP